VLVSDGEARAARPASVLADRPVFPPSRASSKPGESLEDAGWHGKSVGVKNRRLESTRSNITRRSPGPFPSSLMLGFTAHAVTQTVELRDDELERCPMVHARWKWPRRRAFIASQSVDNRSVLIEHWFRCRRRTAGRRTAVAARLSGSGSWPQSAIGGGLSTLASCSAPAFFRRVRRFHCSGGGRL